MSNIPSELKYTETHEWIKIDGNIATIGITDHAQQMLGDLVYIDLPQVGDELKVGGDAAVVESVKTASDVYSPLSGKVIEINETVKANFENISKAPYQKGWLFKLEISDPKEVEHLLTPDDYQKLVSSQ